MQILQIVNASNFGYLVTWPKNEFAKMYCLEGMTSTFFYEPLQYTEDNVLFIPNDMIGRHVSYRINYLYQDGDNYISIDFTNDIKLCKDFDVILLRAIQSFNGGSISFVSEKHYDRYILRCLSDNQIIDTEDCIVTSSAIQEGHDYLVEGYIRDENNEYKLTALSKTWTCHFADIVSDFDPIISIIVPVYNCYDFLCRTLDSILLSSFTNFELLLVDDGSSDGSENICDWYESQHPRVKSFHKVNGGVCTARNYGMDVSVGDFIAFVDNDDIVHPYMYEKLYQATLDENADIAIAQTIMREDFNEYKLVLCAKTDDNKVVMNSFKEVMTAKGSFRNIYFVAIWNKIIRRNIALKVRFVDDLPYYEDTAYTAPVYSYLDKFVLVKDAYYVWDKRKQKTVGTASTTHYHRPSEVIWKYYILSYAAPLFYGNKDNTETMDAYKLDVLKHLLEKYSSHNFVKPIKCVFRGMMKYLVKEYRLPIMLLLVSTNASERKLYAIWDEIEHSDIEAWDGIGEIPKEYY